MTTYERYTKIDTVVTLILGQLNEGKAPYGAAFDRFAGAMPQARIDRLAGQGHLAHVEDPAALARCI